MALVGHISGSSQSNSVIGVSGSVIVANRPNSLFPSLPGTDVTFFVSGALDNTNVSVFGGKLVVSGGINSTTISGSGDFNVGGDLRIAGDLISPREVKNVVSEITGQHFRFFSPGGKKLLGAIIMIIRKLAPGEKELYPAWQGMQYMHNMIDERSKIDVLDNDRYPEIKWTTAKDLLIKNDH